MKMEWPGVKQVTLSLYHDTTHMIRYETNIKAYKYVIYKKIEYKLTKNIKHKI